MANTLTLQSKPELRWGFAVEGTDTTPAAGGAAPAKPIYASNDPDIVEGEPVIDVPLLYGTKYPTTDEKAKGRISPSLSGLEFPMNAYTLSPFFRCLTQYGTKSGSVSTISDSGQFDPVCSGTANITLATAGTPFVLALTRSFELGSRVAQQIYGAVVKTLNINGEDGQTFRLSVDLVGLRYRSADIAAASAAASTYGKIWPVTHFKGSPNNQVVQIWYDLSGSPTAVSATLRSSRISWTNNAEVTGYATNQPQAIGFGDGRLVGSGELRIACDPTTATTPGEPALRTAWSNHTPLGFRIANSGNYGADAPAAAGEFDVRFAFVLTEEPKKQLGPAGIYELTIPYQTIYVSATWPSLKVVAHDNLTTWNG
jgi:hypothetical protein